MSKLRLELSGCFHYLVCDVIFIMPTLARENPPPRSVLVAMSERERERERNGKKFFEPWSYFVALLLSWIFAFEKRKNCAIIWPEALGGPN